MKIKILIFIIIWGFGQILMAQTTEKTYYLTTNLLSPLSGLNKNVAIANALLPVFSNLEYGFTLSGGIIKKSHFTECRITYGKSNAYNIIPQIQIGYHLMLVDYFKKNKNGLYMGLNFRYWDYINKYTNTQRHNLAPSISIGYIWKKNRFITDLRLNQNFAVYTKTNMENTKGGFDFNFSPMPELSPVLPFLSINIGWKLGEGKK